MLASVCHSVNASTSLAAPVIGASPKTIDSGQSSALSATSSFSGGTSPYACEWLQKAPGVSFYSPLGSIFSCIAGSKPSASTGALSTNGTWFFLLQVTDSSPTPQTVNSAPVNVIVNWMGVTTLTLFPSAIDNGQTPTVTANLTWSGGTPPYSVTLYRGTSSTCKSDTTVVSTETGVAGTSTTFLFISPSSTTYYCATVTDSASSRHTVKTPSAALFTVNPALTVTVSPPAPNIDSVQSATLTATPSGGTSPYHYQWYTGSSCASTDAISGATSSSYTTGVLTSTIIYSVNVTDSSITTHAASYCATVTVTVNPALVATISPASSTIDGGQSIKLTADPSEGTFPYSYQWYPGSTCANGSAISGGISSSYTASPTSTTSYSVKVTDSPKGTPPASVCAKADVTVNLALPAPVLTLSRSAMDNGQTLAITANVTWSGGTPPYSVTLYNGTSNICSSDTTVVSSKSGVAGTSTNFTFTVPTVNTEYCARVTDGLTTPETESSTAVQFMVNVLWAPAISARPGAINPGQSSTLDTTVSFAGGTSPYTCQWLEESPGGTSFVTLGSSFTAGCIAGSKPSASTGALTTNGTWSFEFQVTDAADKVAFSSPVTVVVGSLLPTTVTLSCKHASVVVGSVSLCTATVHESGTAAPTGTVTWSSSSPGKFSRTFCELSKRASYGTCSVTFRPTAGGSVTLTANYGGDFKNSPSTGTYILVVLTKTTTTTVSCSPGSIPAASATTFTCKVRVLGYSPTGTVAWSQSGAGSVSFVATTCTLSKGGCSVTLTGAAPIMAAVHASYGGDSNNAPSSGTHTINLGRAKTTLAIACSSTTLSVGAPVTCTATVQNGYFPTGGVIWLRVSGPGKVTFSSRTCTLSSSESCSVTVTATAAGSVKVKTVYVGDSNNLRSLGTLVLTITS